MTSTMTLGNPCAHDGFEVRRDLGRHLRGHVISPLDVPTVILRQDGLRDTAVMDLSELGELPASQPRRARHRATKPRPGGRMWIVYWIHVFLGLTELRSFFGSNSAVMPVLIATGVIGSVATAYYFSGAAYAVATSMAATAAAVQLIFGTDGLMHLFSGVAWVTAGVLNLVALIVRFKRSRANRTGGKRRR